MSEIKKYSSEEIQQARVNEPQNVIDYLLQRKEQWKKTACHLQEQLAAQKKRARMWKYKSKESDKMLKFWKAVCFVASTIAITLVTTLFVTGQIAKKELPRVPASGQMPDSPMSALSSVLIFNGSIQGSGTVISKGDKYATILSAAHNFEGRIGGKFWVYFPDGSYTEATLLSVDKKLDLALARVDAGTILGHVYVPQKMPQTGRRLAAIGYPQSVGPNLRDLTYTGSHQEGSRQLVSWELKNGYTGGGDSGGGIFYDNALISVTSQRSADNSKIYSVCLAEINQFLTNNKNKLKNCGEWSSPPPIMAVYQEKAPPAWSPTSNVPLPRNTLMEQEIAILKKNVSDILRNRELSMTPMKRPSDILKETDGK